MTALIRPQPPWLWLAEHVRTCEVDDQVVLLDLQHGRYAGIGMKHWHAVAGALGASPQPGHGIDVTAGDVARIVRPLLAKGMVTDRPVKHRHPSIAVAAATSSLDTRPAQALRLVTLRRLANFLFATAVASLWLRFFSLQYITLRVEALKLATAHTDGPARAAQLRRAAAAFEQLRPLVFTSRDKCLYDSLALTLFLAREGLSAQWIVGVAIRPFRAHSWVQDGSVVVNDLHEHVRPFRPILVV